MQATKESNFRSEIAMEFLFLTSLASHILRNLHWSCSFKASSKLHENNVLNETCSHAQVYTVPAMLEQTRRARPSPLSSCPSGLLTETSVVLTSSVWWFCARSFARRVFVVIWNWHGLNTPKHYCKLTTKFLSWVLRVHIWILVRWESSVGIILE